MEVGRVTSRRGAGMPSASRHPGACGITAVQRGTQNKASQGGLPSGPLSRRVWKGGEAVAEAQVPTDPPAPRPRPDSQTSGLSLWPTGCPGWKSPRSFPTKPPALPASPEEPRHARPLGPQPCQTHAGGPVVSHWPVFTPWAFHIPTGLWELCFSSR